MAKTFPMVNFRRLSVPLPWPVVVLLLVPRLLFALLGAVVGLLVLVVRHRRVLPEITAVVLLVWGWWRFGWLPLLLALAVAMVLVGVWWWRWPGACRRWLLLPLVSRWRRLWVYRRQWTQALTLSGLVKTFDGGRVVPRLLSVRCTYTTDEVRVRMPRGQTPQVWHKAASALAYSFGTRHCRVFTRASAAPERGGRWAWLLRLVDRWRFRDRPRLITLVFIRRDPLTQIVAPLPVPARPDFTALPLGLREDLVPYTLRLLATHVLIGGATRMGKGSVIWSLIRALASGIGSGLVRVWAIDPKGGVELAIGQPLFARYVDDSWAAMADLLDDAVEVMRHRQARLRGKTRVHTPMVDDPLIVIVIDELACLLALMPDPDLRNRVTASLGLLLSQGAGLGVLVVAATQDPRKEILTVRDWFPTRIALGLNESGHVNLILGDGARDRGALADQIPVTAKGVGYVLLDGQPEPARVRFSYIDDDTIRQMAATFPAPPEPQPEPEPVAETAGPVRVVSNGVRRHTYRPGQARPLLPESLLGALDPGSNGGPA